MTGKPNKSVARRWLDDIKSKCSCAVCKEGHPAVLEFHHRDPDEKKFTISEAVKKGYDLKEIFKESAKCDILCSNCHKKVHYQWREDENNGTNDNGQAAFDFE